MCVVIDWYPLKIKKKVKKKQEKKSYIAIILILAWKTDMLSFLSEMTLEQ